METFSFIIMIIAVAVLLWVVALVFGLVFMYAVMNWIEK
jgi:uncharacterized protein YggT (Ycf19 family)